MVGSISYISYNTDPDGFPAFLFSNICDKVLCFQNGDGSSVCNVNSSAFWFFFFLKKIQKQLNGVFGP